MLSDGRNILILAGTFSALVASAYVLWGPPVKKKRKKGIVCPGLVNFGNSCFLNSLLQAFAPCLSVTQWLTDYLSTKTQQTNSVAHTVNTALKVLNNESIEHTEDYCPSDVMSALKARRWVITPDEQDAHELFHVISETLNEEMETHPSTLSLFEAAKLEESHKCVTGMNRIGTDLPVTLSRSKPSPFTGTLASQLQCKQCGYKNPIRHDHFDSLSLPIPSSLGNDSSLYTMLSYYMKSEMVDKVECDGCSSTEGKENKIKSTFIKKLNIGRLPRSLCIHIQRTTWLDNGLPLKRHDRVRFPETLNMSSFVYQKQLCTKSDKNDRMAGLIGGQENIRRRNDVRSPYSGPVNLLKAMHFHNRLRTHNIRPSSPPPTQSRQNGKNIASIQRLADIYSIEQRCDTATMYKLVAVIVHLGDAFSGHFVTYRRAPAVNGERFPKQWLFCSDTEVYPVNEYDMMSAATAAYMLFYEKI